MTGGLLSVDVSLLVKVRGSISRKETSRKGHISGSLPGANGPRRRSAPMHSPSLHFSQSFLRFSLEVSEAFAFVGFAELSRLLRLGFENEL